MKSDQSSGGDDRSALLRRDPHIAVKVLVIIVMMPFMLPFEVYARTVEPEFRWSKYPAWRQMKRKQAKMRRGEYDP